MEERALITARCSTNDKKQDVTRQTDELLKKYSSFYNIVNVKSYYKSGEKNEAELQEIFEYARENNIQHLIFSEISRIARTVLKIISFIELCSSKKINIIIDNYNMHSLNTDKTVNRMTEATLQLGAIFAQMELRQTQERLNSGRKKYIENGGKLGRLPNTKETKQEFLGKHKDIVKFLNDNYSIRIIMTLTKKSSATIQKVKNLITLKNSNTAVRQPPPE